MEETPRHQCLIYEGSPAKMLPALAAHIKQKLSENYRCLYLNSPTMVAGMRSYLFAIGVDVVYEVAKTSLILTSDQSQLRDGHFDGYQMLRMLEETHNHALTDGYQGLWATGDMTWELGKHADVQMLLEYEWQLEKFFQKYPTMSGICQYHADTLPREMVCHGLMAHPALFINQTLSCINPRYLPSEERVQASTPTSELQHAVDNLCALQPGED
jgi:MEDS: MEthanogen/methylotroph, DcmR Sensory domain